MIPIEDREYNAAVNFVYNSDKISKAIDKICNKNFKFHEAVSLTKEFRDFIYSEIALSSKTNLIKAHKEGKVEYLAIRIILNQIQSTSSPFYKLYRNNQQYIHTDKKRFDTVDDDMFGIVQDSRNINCMFDDDDEDYDPNNLDSLALEDEVYQEKQTDDIYNEILKIVRNLDDYVSSNKGYKLHYRMIWEKKYVEGMNVCEMAKFFDIDKNTLYSNINSINKMIRIKIRERFPDANIFTNK